MKPVLRRRSLIAGAILFALVVAGASLYAQRPGGPPGDTPGGQPGAQARQRFMGGDIASRMVEGSWAFVSFDLAVSDETLVKARKTYVPTWKKMREAAEQMRDATPEARRDIMQTMGATQRELRESLRALLTDEQNAKYDAWLEQQRQRMTPPGGQPGAGDRPGGQQRPRR
jgi:hypothetical protein